MLTAVLDHVKTLLLLQQSRLKVTPAAGAAEE